MNIVAPAPQTYPDTEDALGAARGIIHAALLSVPVWAALAWWLLS